MKAFRISIIFSILVLLYSCQIETGDNSQNVVPCDNSDASESTQIKIPVSFDPKTPLSEELKQANLKDMVIQKYYSFENPNNRRKHKPVLYKRRNSDGVIDLTIGGPLTYEEEWELVEPNHTLAAYFYDAAYIDFTSKWSYSFGKNEQFKYVSVTSNLAKVYFIDDFSGFVHNNKEYCDNIINALEKAKKDAHLRQVEEHQRMYE